MKEYKWSKIKLINVSSKRNTWYCHLLLFIHFLFNSNSDLANFYIKPKPGPGRCEIWYILLYYLCLLLLIKEIVEMGLISEGEYKKVYISAFGFGEGFLPLRKINKWIGCVKYGLFFSSNVSNAYHYHWVITLLSSSAFLFSWSDVYP